MFGKRFSGWNPLIGADVKRIRLVGTAEGAPHFQSFLMCAPLGLIGPLSADRSFLLLFSPFHSEDFDRRSR
jgi:hypothetical protein